MTDFYNKKDQVIYFQRETDDGGVYDPETALTPFAVVGANYAHWRRLDVIPEGTDLIIPKIEKFKRYDISDSKHPSFIASGNIEPQEFTISMDAQGLEFLPLAIGEPTDSSHDRALTQVLTFTDAGPAQGTYFLFDVIETGGDINHYGVWSDTSNDQATGKPTVIGIHADKMLPADTSGVASVTDVANAVETIIETTLTAGTSDITSADTVAGVLTLIHARSGALQRAHDGASSFGLATVSITTGGVTTYASIEGLTHSVPTFSFRVEQGNTDTAAQGIIWDLFCCAIQSITVSSSFGDRVVKVDVTFICPYAAENNAGEVTNHPPTKLIPAFVAHDSLQEGAAAYILMDNNTTDLTPKGVDRVTLTINNNITYKGDISTKYLKYPVAGARNFIMNIVGWTDTKTLFTYWQGLYAASGTEWVPTGATNQLNTVFELRRDATYDKIIIPLYNWYVEEHNFHFVDVGEAIKVVDISLTDGTTNKNGRMVSSATFVSSIDKTIMTKNA